MALGSSTVTLTAGNAIVTGLATTFATTLRIGDMFFCGGFSSPIASIASNTSMTLDLVVPASEAGAGKVWSYTPNQNATLAQEVRNKVTQWLSEWQTIMSGPVGSLVSVSAYAISLLSLTSALAWRTTLGAMSSALATLTLKGVSAGDNIALFFADAGNTTRMTFFVNSAGDVRMINATSGKELSLLGNGVSSLGASDLVVTAAGNVGVGTAAPNAKLQVAGNVSAAALALSSNITLNQTIQFSSQFPVISSSAANALMFYRPGGVAVATNELQHSTSALTVGGFPICHQGRPNVIFAATVATVPSASGLGGGAEIYVTNESGGAVLAFSDGANWRRVTDRAIIS